MSLTKQSPAVLKGCGEFMYQAYHSNSKEDYS